MATTQNAYPYVNGGMTDFANVTAFIGVGGSTLQSIAQIPYTGFTSVEYGWGFNGGEQHGASRAPLGKTIGQCSFRASMTMYKSTYDLLVAGLAASSLVPNIVSPAPSVSQLLPVGVGGYGQVFFGMKLTYSFEASTFGPFAGTIVNAILFGCTMKSMQQRHSSGGAALEVTVDFDPVYIVENDTAPTSDLNYLQQAAAIFAILP